MTEETQSKKPQRAKRDKATSFKTAYINNKDFYESMLQWHTARKEAEANGDLKPVPMPPYAGKCILLIAQNLGRKGNFFGYTYNDEMIGDAVLCCVRYAKNFDPSRTNNPFAYFTQICYNTFIGRIGIEKKQRYIVAKNMVHNMVTEDLVEYGEGSSDEAMSVMDNQQHYQENIDSFVRDFEEKNNLSKDSVRKKQTDNTINPLGDLFE